MKTHPTLKTIFVGFALATFAVSCKKETPVAPPAPTGEPAATSKAATEGKQALDAAKVSMAHAGAALKDLAGTAKDKAGAALEVAKHKLQDFGHKDFNEMLNSLEGGLRTAKTKGGEAWTAVKSVGPATVEKLKALIAALPEDKKEAAKAKLQQLQDVLDEKKELPAEAPAPQ